MKIIRQYNWLVTWGLIISCLLLENCSHDDSESIPEISLASKAIVRVDVSLPAFSNENYVSTLRFIVFDNATSTGMTEIDVNQITHVNQKSSRLQALLSVNCNSDIAIAAIINEPFALSAYLDNVTTIEQLEQIQYSFAHVFNENATGKNVAAPALLLPMTGLKCGIEVTAANHSEATACQVSMHVDRAVAKVTFYVQCSTQVTNGTYVLGAGYTQLLLNHTADKGYLFAGTEEDLTRFQSTPSLNYGIMQTIQPTALKTNRWTPSSDISVTQTPQELISFYLPERTCQLDEDKLEFQLNNVFASDVDKNFNYGSTLTRIRDRNGIEQDFSLIRRNNEYVIYCQLNLFELNLDIQEWLPVNIDGSILGSYLNLSTLNYSIPSYSSASIDIPFETDATQIYIDWSELTGVRRVGLPDPDNSNGTILSVVDGNGIIHLEWNGEVPAWTASKTLIIVAGNIRRSITISKIETTIN